MSATIVLFGATGFTGRLTATALVRRGAKPVLAGRDRRRLQALASELGGLATHTVDAESSGSIASALAAGDVLVTTVGPFSRFGDAAAEAAIGTGANYVDCAGEPAFNRRVFEHFGPRARSAGSVMLTGFATEWILGNVAAGLALERSGSEATRVDVGYFLIRGQRALSLRSLASGLSASSAASGVSLLGEPSFAWRSGRLAGERWAARMATFRLGETKLRGVSSGGTEHLALPRSFPALEEVNVWFGWFGGLSRFLHLASPAVGPVLRSAALRHRLQGLLSAARGSGGGPSSGEHADVSSLTLGAAFDRNGRELQRVALEGPDLYSSTAEFLAFGAHELANGAAKRRGAALGPIEAFGLPALIDASRTAGIRTSTISVIRRSARGASCSRW